MEVPKAAIYLSAIFCLSLLGFILWCTRTLRKRVMIVGGAAVLGCLLAVLSVPVASHVFCTLVHPGIGIRRTGERLFVEDTLRPSTALIRLLHPGVAQPGPHMTGEILSDSPDRLFERMSGIPMGISRDQRGEVTRLTAHFLGGEFSFRKVSVQPPKYSLPPKLRTAISLDTNLLDACVGRYEVAPQPVWPREGAILTICREGEQLLLRVAAKDISQAPIEIYPESPTNFFLKINDEQLTFLKSNKGEVMAVVHHMDGLPDVAGRKQTVSSN
jgi:hypothetical protein